ncbi:MAG: replicative DNA helicase [Richelia sp. RM2_1_2]|nr:replicative DNA helicase [Richelia sp. RM1_1_1]NJO65758.1 replicative DNA helicase [Richelia sp. RM2_1_2]
MIDKLPPANIEAEEAILGGILLDPSAISRICEYLVPDAFYISSHTEIYQALLRLHHHGKPTDLLTVIDWLYDHDLLMRIGGRNKLVSLLERTVSAVNIDVLASLVMQKYIRRRLINVSHQINELAYQTETDLSTIIETSQQKLYQVSNEQFCTSTEHNSAIAHCAYTDLESNKPIYPTGFKEFDKLIIGFEPGTFTIVAGRPSMGKSMIAMNLALATIQKHNLPVVIFSLEMSKMQLEYRLWSTISVNKQYESLLIKPLKSDRIRRHRSGFNPLSDIEFASLAKIAGISGELPLYINDSRSITVAGIISECRQIQAREGVLGLVIVDYLQMMAPDTQGNRSYELGDVARGLYKMASELDVPVLALSQINRAVEGRNNKRPMMSDLSQSGILEMVADNIILLYRDEYYHPKTVDKGILELIVAKARHGETGTAVLLMDTAYSIIRNTQN